MSGWHREHPELVGTDADPWMIHADYRRAMALPTSGMTPTDAQIEEAMRQSAMVCTDPDCRQSQPEGDVCREQGCNGRLTEREP